MIWNKHSTLEGQHAFLGASKYSWLNYDEARLILAWERAQATERGTRLHAFAAEAIRLQQKLPRSTRTLNAYVNDAIGFGLDPEVLLYYSKYCFGTADAIGFVKNVLRISDLKTGENPAKMDQLKIYAALFCLEYHVNPETIRIELRIYQNDSVEYCEPDPKEIAAIMKHIVNSDKILSEHEVMEGRS